ncbi:hypothetical protein EBZ80_07820 [bacterium]|nr:hypothetical protein [bacterium]
MEKRPQPNVTAGQFFRNFPFLLNISTNRSTLFQAFRQSTNGTPDGKIKGKPTKFVHHEPRTRSSS